MPWRRRRRPDLLEQLHEERTSAPAARPPTERFKAGSLPLLGVFVAVVIATVFAQQSRPPYPEVAPSCTAGAIALAPTVVAQREDVRFTLVGPDGDVLLALDTAAVSRDLVATPSRPGAVTQVFELEPMLNCATRDSFPAQVPVGEHTVTAFRLVHGEWAPLASAPLTVR